MNNWNQNQQQNNFTVGQAQFNPYQQSMWGNYQQQRLPVYHAEPIHGENAAWQFPMAPNSDIWLPDADEDIIWWIRTDTNGNKSVEPFDVNPHKKPEPVNMNDVLARLTAVEEWINGKQNKSNAKRTATVSANPSNGATTTTE